MARLALLCLACRAASREGVTDASEARRLSATDHRTFRGKLDPPAAGRGRHHLFIHIPKAAGTSFMKASVDWMTRADTLTGSVESAAFSGRTVGKLKQGPPGAVPGRVVMLRHPVQLAVSQFSYCKHVLKQKMNGFPGNARNATGGRSKVPFAGLAKWAAHRPAATYWRCYNPEDVQFRFVVGRVEIRILRRVPPRHRRDAFSMATQVVGRGGARSIAPGARGELRHATPASACATLERDFFFVGVVEAMRESLCLFRYLNTLARPPDYCACGSTAAFPPVTRTHAHGWYRSDAADLAEGLRAAVRALVPRDLVLYLHGLHLLEETSKKCERATGVRVLCPAKVEKMWAAALKDACAVNNNAGGAYNRTCPGPRATGGGTNP